MKVRKYRALFASAFRSELQYRGNFIAGVVGGLAYQTVGIAFIGVILARYDSIGGWGFAEIALLYGIRLTGHGLWVFWFGQLINVDTVVREGEFDRYLLRPISPLTQLITRRQHLSSIGDLVGGLVLLSWAAHLNDIQWTPLTVAYLVLVVVGGALIELSIQLAASSLVFRFKSTRGLKLAVDQIFNTFGNYPVKIFGPLTRFALTFLLPLAFIAYVPASVLLGRTNELALPAWLAYACPAVGAAMFAVALLFWSRQSAHYESSGH